MVVLGRGAVYDERGTPVPCLPKAKGHTRAQRVGGSASGGIWILDLGATAQDSVGDARFTVRG